MTYDKKNQTRNEFAIKIVLFLHKIFSMKTDSLEVLALRKAVEASIPREIKTSYDFNYLSGVINGRTKEKLSESTLKRVWGYVEGYGTINLHTLQVLARFAGYESFEAFHEIFSKSNESNEVLGKSIKSSELKIGDQIFFTWLPDRSCTVEYLGENRFTVLKSANTQLRVGDIFTASYFFIEEPLYLDNLERSGKIYPTYVVGKKTGLTSLRLND